MCGFTQKTQEEKYEELHVQQEQRKELENQQQLLRDHLVSLQNWDIGEEGTLEEKHAQYNALVMERQREANVQLMGHAERQMPQLQANQTAAGQPQQMQAPAKQTYKQKREEKRRDRKAKRINPEADHVTYQIAKDMKHLNEERGNSLTAEQIARAEEANVDRRVLKVFVHGYKKDRNGNPASEDDARDKAEDERFLDDYLSCDVERRRPHLDRITKELLDANITEDMFSRAYLEHHSAEMKVLADRLTYYENIFRDPVNAPYFDNLPQLQRDLINARIISVYAAVGNKFANSMAENGYDSNNTRYYAASDLDAMRFARANSDGMSTFLRQSLADSHRFEDEAIQRQYEAELESCRAARLTEAERMRAEADTSEDLKEISQLGFTGFVTGYSFDNLAKYRNMIEGNPEAYAANQEAIDKLYQELYRVIDSQGTMLLEAASYQDIIDTHQEQMQGNAAERQYRYRMHQSLIRKAAAQQQDLAKQIDLINSQINALHGSLDFFLRGKELRDDVKALLDGMGLGGLAQQINVSRMLDKTFGGPDGAIAQSNQAYDDAVAKGESAETIRSSALQGLGIRTSTSPAAQIDKMVRGTTYVGIPGQIAVYIHQLDSSQDLTAVDAQLQRMELGERAARLSVGGGIEEISINMLNALQETFTSPESISYLRVMSDRLKDAKVFGGNQRATVEFLMFSLMNSYGANFTMINPDECQGGVATRTVAREACRNLLSISGTSELPADAPEGIQQLFNNYQQLLNRIMDNLGE